MIYSYLAVGQVDVFQYLLEDTIFWRVHIRVESMSFDIYEVAQKCLFQERIKRCLWTSSLCLKLNYLYVVCTYTLTLYITYVVLEGAFKGRINLLIHEIYEVAQKCLFHEGIKRCLWTSSLPLKLI